MVGVGYVRDEPLEPQPSQVVGHLGVGVGFQWYSQELGDGLTEHFTAHTASIYPFIEVSVLS